MITFFLQEEKQTNENLEATGAFLPTTATEYFSIPGEMEDIGN